MNRRIDILLLIISAMPLINSGWAIPQGWYSVASVDCGTESGDSFLDTGDSYRYPESDLSLEKISAADPMRTVAYGEEVAYVFGNFQPEAKYAVRISFLSEKGGRIQNLMANDMILQDNIELPDGSPVTLEFELSPAIYQAGEVTIATHRIAGPNAVIAALEIFSDRTGPLTAPADSPETLPEPTYTAIPVNAKIMDLNGAWQFNPVSDERPLPPRGRGWSTIQVPGEWSMQGFTVDRAAEYRRDIDIPLEWQSRCVKLRFDAVYGDAEILVNSKIAGRHSGTYTPFEFDITNLIHCGVNNEVRVRVTANTRADRLATGSKYAVHPLYGIARKVSLFAVPQLHIQNFHVATDLDDQYRDAILKAGMKLINTSTLPVHEVEVLFKLKTWPEEKYVEITNHSFTIPIPQNANNIQSIEPNQSNKPAMTNQVFHLAVEQPRKWDCEHPNLYTLECQLKQNNTIIETVRQRFGFRELAVSGNRFLLNGVPVKLHGVDRHEVHPLTGRSLKPEDNWWRKDAELFKAMNCNYIRTSHYPPAEEFIDACDEIGLFVEEEAPICWGNDGSRLNRPIVLQSTAEMISRDRSHPSVIIWSLANESKWQKNYQLSFALAEKLDPTRPKTFHDQCWNNSHSTTQIANQHYPGPGGPERANKEDRPVLFGEFCHLNCYNHEELVTDPGLRDAWGLVLASMWEAMYRSDGCLGGAIWSGIDDTFFLPDGKVVGYGPWGPLDGWRRLKPEAWHVFKTYAPVQIELGEQTEEQICLQVENRFGFTDLNECWIHWQCNGRNGQLKMELTPGKRGSLTLPVKVSDLDNMMLDIKVYDPVDRLVQHTRFGNNSQIETPMTPSGKPFQAKQSGSTLTAESTGMRIRFDLKTGLFISIESDGQTILTGGPTLMLLADYFPPDSTAQMIGTDQFESYTAPCTNWTCTNIDWQQADSGVTTIKVSGHTDQAEGTYTIDLDRGGRITVAYNFTNKEEIKARQIGLVFDVPKSQSTLSWQRQGQWSVYPDDHIGRLNGKARAFYGTPPVRYAGPSKEPKTPWSRDDTVLGSHDFRATRTGIHWAQLTGLSGKGIRVLSDGSQAVRAWVDSDTIRMLVADHNSIGAERFLRSHASPWSKTLKAGENITGQATIRITP